eukprot:TRINITY_DN18844_c0_g1_i1.p1 TRINITY_DN18844_c0_g1~~TRINITY_DN18844_c0_g1_i1.p1  ORF type:complete len:351 (-),score=79.36 TRINITY_DN18844_c0_g1_i1:136-1188(-)
MAGGNMYGRMGMNRQLGMQRPSPYGHVIPQTHNSDPLHQQALEQLLRTVAERTAHMSTNDILELSASFAQIVDGATGGSSGPAPSSGGWGGHGQGGGGGGYQGTMIAIQDDYGDYGGYGGYEMPQHNRYLPVLADVIGGASTVKVSAKTNVKSIAGAVAKALRGAEIVVATAVGPEGINHAMKAFSIARCYLAADGMDFNSSVIETQPDQGISQGKCYAFKVHRISVPAAQASALVGQGVGRAEPLPRQARPPELQVEMKCSGHGNTGPLAGAITKCLREEKEALITAIGPASVAKCVEALALARDYLQKERFELQMFPGFETITMKDGAPGAGETRSSVKVRAWAEPLQ